MGEIVVISGKGGTGKTSLTAAFAHLAAAQGQGALLCDLDVDAPDLHIILEPRVQREAEFISGYEAVIDPQGCTGCGTCADMCRFGAVTLQNGVATVSALHCEGCGVCAAFCPAGAVTLEPRLCGRRYESQTRFGPMVHAQLLPGQENSGRLVALLRQRAKELAREQSLGLILCDGAPGIGCPVISSLTGTGLAVIVTEPTPSGCHDLERVAGLCDHFRIPVAVVVNKFDLNPEQSAAIAARCEERGHHLAGMLPFAPEVVAAMSRLRAVTEGPDTPFTDAVRGAWNTILALASDISGTGSLSPLQPKDSTS